MVRKGYLRKDNMALFDSAFKHAPIGMALMDTSGRFLKINEALRRLIGYDEAELLNRMFIDISHPDEIYKEVVQADLLLSGRLDSYRLEKRYIHKEGHCVKAVLHTSVVRNGRGMPLYLIAQIEGRDCPETGRETRRYEELYRLVTEQSQDVIAFCSANMDILYISPAVTVLLGYAPEEMVGRNEVDYRHPEDPQLPQIWSEDRYGQTSRYRHKEGHYVWFDSTVRIVRDENGAVDSILLLAKDITEQTKTMELLNNSERLSIAGQLAAGIAHEIRNPLTAIRGFHQLMQNGGAKQQYFDILSSEINRIESILTELLMLAKPQQVKFDHNDIVSLLVQVTSLLETQAVLTNIRLAIRCEHRSLYLRCDENQIKQVLINLIKNAMEAMPEGGDVLIEVQAAEDRLHIEVSDKGKGIPNHVLAHIGEPFYTTKEKGTGLGLMITQRIIANHQGSMKIDSRFGEGTTFRIEFPLGSEPKAAEIGKA
ncbi:PAS domain S-box protein [Paenibacillus hodogayensis]|uniref:histidine kinase n=1 Tax=Paenibacillus hodogayensis TaxID=279208 RepID=A0ABV5VWW4_9BACL